METSKVKEFTSSRLPGLLKEREREILEAWMADQSKSITQRHDLISDENLYREAEEFLRLLGETLQSAPLDSIEDHSWDELKLVLGDVSQARVRRGFTPSDSAMFIFSLKQPLFDSLRRDLQDDWEVLARESRIMSMVLDSLGLYTMELYQRDREAIIQRQREEMLELSTPVVQLWEKIVALPLIGTLDSERTQVVMESLLQRIVQTGAEIAIVDITGVPTVDTLVAQHLLKAVSAARLMGAECIISGIRPQIAQTIVHLGVDLQGVTTKATLASAFAEAIDRLDLAITPVGQKHQ